MSTDTVLKCDVCGAVIAPSVRRFVFTAMLQAENGEKHMDGFGPSDLCSEQCLYASLRGLVEKVAIIPKEESHGG